MSLYPSVSVEAAAAGNYPYRRFNQRERKILQSVKAYVDGISLVSANYGAASIPLAALSTGIAPSHVVKYAGSFNTLGGGTAETITLSGLLVSDIAFVVVKTKGATPRSIVAAAAAAGQINVTMSGDASTDHVLAYQVLRAAS